MGPHHSERELFRATPRLPSVSNRPSSTEPPCCPHSRGPQRCGVIPDVIRYYFVLASMIDVTAVGLHIGHWKLNQTQFFLIDFIQTEHFFIGSPGWFFCCIDCLFLCFLKIKENVALHYSHFPAELSIPCLYCAPKQSPQTQPAGNRRTCSSPASVFHRQNPISQLETSGSHWMRV